MFTNGQDEQVDQLLSPAGTFMHVTCYILIIVGFLVALISIIGAVGAITGKRGLLITYCVILSVAVVAEGFTSAFVMINQPYREADYKLRTTLDYTFSKGYYGDQFSFGSDRSIQMNLVTLAWNQMQTKLQCCGMTGGNDFINQRIKLSDKYRAMGTVPLTCCRLQNVHKELVSSLRSSQPIPQSESCPSRPDTINSFTGHGCYSAFWEWLIARAIMFTIVSAVSGLFQIVSIILTISRLFAVSKQDAMDNAEEIYVHGFVPSNMIKHTERLRSSIRGKNRGQSKVRSTNGRMSDENVPMVTKPKHRSPRPLQHDV